MTAETLHVARFEDDGTSKTELHVALAHVDAMCVLTLRGALRAGSVRVLEAEFDRLGTSSFHRVVVDATELTSLDETGKRVLTGLAHYVRGRGGVLSVIGGSNPIARALEVELVHE
jgi:anti-anti-sigma factor